MRYRNLFQFACIIFLVHFSLPLAAQNGYDYSVDLNDVKNDQLHIELTCPKVTASEIVFYMPKIVPGTYRYSDFGKFVHDLKAFDKAGKALPVKQTSPDSWQISTANRLSKIEYNVEDTWDAAFENDVFTMAGTNFEAGKNFVLNTCGIFGYLDKMKDQPFRLHISKPEGFYGSTGLEPTTTTATLDNFSCKNADLLYDSPIMYCRPDTTTILVGTTKVLVSVYSPKNKVHAAFVAQNLTQLLQGANQYLGGKLPVDKYAFIYYFNGEQAPLKTSGAWEHPYSSFYSLEEIPEAQGMASWADMSAHEFFHIVTPLTIASREIKEFNFNQPVLSKHLWLYEGSTEYDAHHMQVKSGLNTPEEFIKKLAEKIQYSRQVLNDTIPFTVLSKESAGKYKEQYVNVYMKGALISACLDLYLLHLSGGAYGLTDMKHDLGVRYGKNNYFNDDELFDEITRLTYPQVRSFFSNYVEKGTPIPYEEFFSYAGINYLPKVNTRSFTLGGFQVGATPDGKITVGGTEQINEFGKKMGYQKGDEIVSLNKQAVNTSNFGQLIQGFYAGAKEGDVVTIEVKRGSGADAQMVTLTAPAMKVQRTELHKLEISKTPTAEQLRIRNAWLGSKTMETGILGQNGSANDVSSIDGIVKAVYDVISGPAGARNWDRFKSLFYPGAYMGATIPAPQGSVFKKFSPEEYIKMNDAMLKQFSFTEKEIGRTTNIFGNIAQVFTTYEFVLDTPNPMKQKGINGLELVRENNRWYIMSIIWEDESTANVIPNKFTRGIN